MRHSLRMGVGALFAVAALAASGTVASAATDHSPRSVVTTASKAKTHKPKAKTTTTTKPASNIFFTQALVGTKRTRQFTAKTKWRLSYYYNCSGKKGKFTLYLRPKTGHSIKVTSQSGLGGGGARIYHKGRYTLSATTTCTWTIKATKT
jgi:hypothetical protein